MPSAIVIIDTETTGLNFRCHEPWEVAAVRLAPGKPPAWFHAFAEVDLEEADPAALEVGKFHERHPWATPFRPSGSRTPVLTVEDLGLKVCSFTADAVLVGTNPTFDVQMLERVLFRAGVSPQWHYSPIDIKSMVAGYLLGRAPRSGINRSTVAIPWSSTDLSSAIDVPRDEAFAHTARGDVEWVLAQLQVLAGPTLEALLGDPS